MTKPMRQTPDSAATHEAPLVHDDRNAELAANHRRNWRKAQARRKRTNHVSDAVNAIVSRLGRFGFKAHVGRASGPRERGLNTAEREPALSPDDDGKELGRYLDALLDRELATALTPYGESYRALQRGDIDIFEHDARRIAAMPKIPISTDAAGKEHLSPSWRAFDPGLAREIRYQIRAIETSRRFPSAATLQLPFEGIPAHGERPEGIVLPTPQYRGAKAGRKIVGVGRPTAKVAPTFYLPRMSEVNDTLSASSARSLVGGGKFGDKQPRADRVSDSDQYEAIALCIDLARAVVERIVSVDALAEVLIRLGAPLSVRETCFGLLGHRDRKRLGKALRA